jgi:hypothetical protein
MQSFKANSYLNKKFLHSIENSYNEEFYHDTSLSCKYAQLNITDTDSCFIKMSSFLMNQLNLFQLNPKVHVLNIISTNLLETTTTTTTKKKIKIKLKTNNKNNDTKIKVKESFLKFIDQQTECLCPVILTNKMICQFDHYKCLISLQDNEFIAINSNTLLNDLLSIDIELVGEQDYTNKIDSNSLKIKQFNLAKILECKWFQSNIDVIMLHLNKNLFNNDNNSSALFNRNLVITGLKGSGKTTICKYICNLISNKSMYHYVNCQQFMNKTPETIYEQLKLIYLECLWHNLTPSLVILDNLDLLIENKSHTIDPSAMLYHAQIVQVIKEILVRFVWNNNENMGVKSNVCTIVTISSPFNEMPALFHCNYFNF